MTRRTLTSVALAPPVPPVSSWPISASANKRYLVDNTGAPWLMVGDNSLQSVMSGITEDDASIVFQTRDNQGFNACWIHLYSNYGGNVMGNPFNTMTDVSTPNETFFAHVDRILNMAKTHGMLVFLDVAGLNGRGNDTAFNNNGTTKLNNFGKYLGNRYRAQGNIVWTYGNDWPQGTGDSQILALANGIQSADTGGHPMAVETFPVPSLSTDRTQFQSLIDINCVYTYAPSWITNKRGWNLASPKPVGGFEYQYEGGTLEGYTGTLRIVRSNMHWGQLYGGNAGQQYGHSAVWNLNHSRMGNLTSPGAQQVVFFKNLYVGRRWYDLVPDFGHTIGTAGLGLMQQPGQNNAMGTMEATTVAATADGALCIAYMERRRDLTINMTKLANGLSAKWYNPAMGTYTAGGGPFANTGSRVFSPPNRTTNDNDWALVLEP